MSNANSGPRIVFHGSNEIVTAPIIPVTLYMKDFGFGFYTTEMKNQAAAWAISRVQVNGKSPYVSKYLYTPSVSLSCLHFDTTLYEWLNFVADCRHGKNHKSDLKFVPRKLHGRRSSTPAGTGR